MYPITSFIFDLWHFMKSNPSFDFSIATFCSREGSFMHVDEMSCHPVSYLVENSFLLQNVYYAIKDDIISNL